MGVGIRRCVVRKGVETIVRIGFGGSMVCTYVYKEVKVYGEG